MSNGDGGNAGVADGESYDLFLCHNAADKDWVRALAREVESETLEGTPEGRRLRVFFDEWDIEPGQNIVTRINDGLLKARYVGVVLSPELLRSRWATLEWTSVVAEDPGNGDGKIIPILLRDGTEDGGGGIELPAPLSVLQWLDFRNKTDFQEEYQKLIQKVRGLPIVREEKRRSGGGRNRRLIIASCLLCALALGGVFLWNLSGATPQPHAAAEPSSVNCRAGETVDIVLTVRNQGEASSEESYLTVSVPDDLDIVRWRADSSEVRYVNQQPGDTIVTATGEGIARGEMLDVYKRYNPRECVVVTVGIKALTVGRHSVKYRTAFDGRSIGLRFVRFPAHAKATDQQGFPVMEVPFTVE